MNDTHIGLNELFSEPVRAEESTAVLCIRLHDSNPWALSRLEYLLSYYDPKPKYIVVDFGSDETHRAQIKATCVKGGADYQHVPDYGVFSLSQARNHGAAVATTDFLYFTDVDFLSERDLFGQLAKGATACSMRDRVDAMLDLPAYHLTKTATDRLRQRQDRHDETSMLLARYGSDGQHTSFGDIVEFVAPYGNNFLVRKLFFDLVGGYHADFRGHGSEDFEFFIRASIVSGNFPTPPDLIRDWDGPTKAGFWKTRPYRGFRALNQLIASRAERLGLRTFHLWHPINKEEAWRQSNDWKRSRLTEIAEPYISRHHAVLSIDSLPRAKSMLCVCKDQSHWGYFLPFRALGYRLTPIFDDNPSTVDMLAQQIESGEFDSFAIFNPYMKSHSKFYGAFLRARELRREVFVVERGALPETVYYADDVSYNSSWFSEQSFASENLSDDEIHGAQRYISDLRSGTKLLEAASDRRATESKYASIRRLQRLSVLVPLQLHDDMAVTKFVRNSQSYSEFVESLVPVARENPDVLFIIKPHPLSKYTFPIMPENVIMADREDNIHALIDCCETLICYNSGVGLLAACHERRLITIGNAFYNHAGIGHFADDLRHAVAMCRDNVAPPDPLKLAKLIGVFIYRRYSKFSATDVLRDFKDRKAHGYANIKLMRFVTQSGTLDLNWEAGSSPFGRRSYAAGISNFGDLGDSQPEMKKMSEHPSSIDQIKRTAVAALADQSFAAAESHFVAGFAMSKKPAWLRAAAEAALLAGNRDAAVQHLEKAAALAQRKSGIVKRAREIRRPSWLHFLPKHPYDPAEL